MTGTEPGCLDAADHDYVRRRRTDAHRGSGYSHVSRLATRGTHRLRKAEDFAYTDDPEFSTIRRKLARWAADNVPIVKELRPPQPPGFNNRLSANWKPLLQIAQHAGGGWPERARRSAIYLSRAPYEPSVRVQLLAALRAMFTKKGTEIHIGAGGAGASRPSRF